MSSTDEQELLLEYKNYVENWKNSIKSILDNNKKTVAFFSHIETYHSLFGNLHKSFKKANWNVINLKTILSNDKEFDKKAPTFIIPNFTSEQGFITNIDIDFIDIMISTNCTDVRFLSNSAKGIYLSHDMLTGIIPAIETKYVFIASSNAVKHLLYEKHGYNIKGHCLIKGGYPKLDYVINNYNKQKSKKKEKYILYAPTAREATTDLQQFSQQTVGFDYHVIQILLENFSEDIIYRVHPTDRNSLFFNIIKEKFNNKRIFISTRSSLEDYLESKLLITDISDTAITYSLSTLKPSIFYIPGCKTLNSLIKPTKKIAIEAHTLDELVDSVDYLLKNKNKHKKKIKKYREKHIFNLKKSEQYLIDNIDYILQDKKHKDWIYL